MKHTFDLSFFFHSPCQVQPQPSTSKEEHNERNDCVNPDLTEKTSDETIMDDDEQEDSNQTTEPLTETTKDSEMPDSDGTEKNAQQSTSFTASRSSSSHSSSDDPISHRFVMVSKSLLHFSFLCFCRVKKEKRKNK